MEFLQAVCNFDKKLFFTIQEQLSIRTPLRIIHLVRTQNFLKN